jgi:hypothetical protein
LAIVAASFGRPQMHNGVKLAIAVLVAVSFVKVNAFAPAIHRGTQIQIGVPWMAPIDSPQASCIRGIEEPVIFCAAKSHFAHTSSALTLFEIGECPACYRASLELAKFGKSRSDVAARLAQMDTFTQ